MKTKVRFLSFSFIFCWFFFSQSSLAQEAEQVVEQERKLAEKIEKLEEPLYTPFIERYLLDEVKTIRQEQQILRTEIAEKLAGAKLESSDRALRYTSDTVNNVFFIITAAASVLVLMGWRSLRDIQTQIEEHVSNKVSSVSDEYEKRLSDVEEKLKKRSEQIISTQEEIARANQLHALWMRAGLENNPQQKVKLYDEILDLHSEDVEAITYKADAVLELGECEWALNLSSKALELDQDYALAYWQRACAHAALGQIESAIEDIHIALEKSPVLASELAHESMFQTLYEEEEFKKLLA
ncbi:tetratricopeptide repeat protein [Catenovulum sediminis]|uniref:Tetratricopeptide repeat protein n=1 Tax=Catenovulum sediminis TaxID=1740262 RepID=A0ABV1RI01_9ALTE|nr:tetratricopeptide repeat protein [Catenovulum sediminis]